MTRPEPTGGRPYPPRPASGRPQAEAAIDPELVRRLLADQHPDLAALPLQAVGAGWDNALLRLGSDLLVRLPRRALAADLIRIEQRWLPQLARRLPVPVPAPRRTGRPGAGYPWPWSIVPWLEGDPGDSASPGPELPTALGGFLRALHSRPGPPPSAPRNPLRAVPLRARANTVEPRLDELAGRLGQGVVAPLRDAWRSGSEAPLDLPPSWVHGDLHPRNVLLDDRGSLAAVLDWGDLTAGDPATDLAALWMLLPGAAARERALAAWGPASEATVARARGWAAFYGALFLTAAAAEPDGADDHLGRRIVAHLAD